MRTPFYLYLSLCVSVSLIHTPAPKALGLVEIFILELELQALSSRSFRCHRALRKQESLLSSLSTFQVSGWAVIKGGDWLCFIPPGKGRTEMYPCTNSGWRETNVFQQSNFVSNSLYVTDPSLLEQRGSNT